MCRDTVLSCHRSVTLSIIGRTVDPDANRSKTLITIFVSFKDRLVLESERWKENPSESLRYTCQLSPRWQKLREVSDWTWKTASCKLIEVIRGQTIRPTLSERGRQWQYWQAVKIFLRNSRIFEGISFL